MPTTKELREKRAPIRAALGKLGDKIKGEGRAMNAEERGEFEKLSKDFGELTRAIQDAEAFDHFSNDDGDSDPLAGRGNSNPRRDKRKKERDAGNVPTEEDRATSIQAWMRMANGMPLKTRHAEACKRTGLNPRSKELKIRLPQRSVIPARGGKAARVEIRDGSVAQADKGGYTVAPEYARTLEEAMLAYNGVRQVADILRTSTGAPMPWPTSNDTSNEGEQLDENTAGNAQDVAFASTTLNAYKYGSKPILLSYELLNDSAFNLMPVVFGMAGTRIGRRQARAFTTGTGSGEPLGAVVGSSLGRTAASATALAVDDFVKLLHSVDPAYRSDPSFAFMMHDAILAVTALIKDGENRPIFMESYRDGEVDRIMKKPVVINQNMDSTMSSTKKTVLAGTWSKYKIRDVGTVRFKRLDERYAEKDQVGFLAFLRSDGRILDAGTNPIRHIVH